MPEAVPLSLHQAFDSALQSGGAEARALLVQPCIYLVEIFDFAKNDDENRERDK